MILSLGFDGEESRANAGKFHLTANHAGIVASLAIHAVFLFFIVISPTANMVAVKTFHISFDEGGSSFSQNNPGPSVAGGKIKTARFNNRMKRRNPPAQPNRAKIQGNATGASPAAARGIATAESFSASKTKESAKADETTLPPGLQGVKGDEFITATDSSSESGHGKMNGFLQNSDGAFPGIAATGAGGSGSGAVSGSNSGDYASTGTGGGPPLETSFGETNAPSFIHRAMPVYPPLARRRGKEGRVVLTLLIDQAGIVQKIDVTEPAGYGLAEAAIEAVKKSTFAPAHVNGKKVVSRAVLPVRFKLE